MLVWYHTDNNKSYLTGIFRDFFEKVYQLEHTNLRIPLKFFLLKL